MSAYIVSKSHIVYLVAAAMSRRLSKQVHYSFSYYHGEARHELKAGDYQAAADMANMLWMENIKSVSARYPSESSATLPGPVGEDFVVTIADIPGHVEIDPVQVFKSIDCYSYQSCEHDGWRASAAFAFCESLRKAACSSIIGYDDAAWGAPEPKARRNRAA